MSPSVRPWPAMLFFAAACAQSPAQEQELRHFDLDDLEGVLARDGVTLDSGTASQGTAALRIEAGEPTTVRLFELTDIDVEDARLVYRAKLRTEGVTGSVYLEMWCRFPEGEFFSRALHQPLTGSTDWTTQETPFFLKKGQNPQEVKLNVVVAGAGTVWVDDVSLACASM